jgi:hypothetical protein
MGIQNDEFSLEIESAFRLVILLHRGLLGKFQAGLLDHQVANLQIKKLHVSTKTGNNSSRFFSEETAVGPIAQRTIEK